MQLALEEAGVKPEELDYLNLHATSTPIGDIAEVNAVKQYSENQKSSCKLYKIHDWAPAWCCRSY